MTAIFLEVVNRGVAASWVILAVLLLRLALRRAPKWVRVLLWGLVAVRLLCPFSIQSAVSLIPSAETVSPAVLLQDAPTVQSGVPFLDHVGNTVLEDMSLPTPGDSVNPLQVWMTLLAWLWLGGVLLLLAYAAVSYGRLRRRVAAAVRLRNNIYQSENVVSPFLLGIVQPRIYLPYGLSEGDREHVIAHEQAHIRRGDHAWKPLGFLLLAVYWWNPLMWLAYALLCRDIELACDERVIRGLDREQRADYTQALVDCSVSRRRIAACPLAFGEAGVKARVKSVMHYKKPGFWIVVLAVLVCAAVAVCFLTDPVEEVPDGSYLDYANAVPLAAQQEEVAVLYYPPEGDSIQVGAAEGSALAEYLEQCRWRACSAPGRLASLGSVEFILQEDYRITVHTRKENSLWQYARVEYQGQERYYHIGMGDYQEAVSILYVNAPVERAVRWVDSLNDPSKMPDTLATEIPDYPGVTFSYSPGSITAAEPGEEPITLMQGMPIWNVYFCDLTGDGHPEICATYSFGSGIVDTRIVIYDYVNGASYELADRGRYDFTLQLGEDGGLYVEKTEYPRGQRVSWGRLAFRDGCLQLLPVPGDAFYLTVGAENAAHITVMAPDRVGAYASGSLPYAKGARIWLDCLDGASNLRGVTVTAQDAAGDVVWSVSIPDADENEGTTRIVQDGWEISNLA